MISAEKLNESINHNSDKGFLLYFDKLHSSCLSAFKIHLWPLPFLSFNFLLPVVLILGVV